MFIAHIPGGYLLTKAILRKKGLPLAPYLAFMVLGMLGSTFPDIDLFYFYLIDDQENNHHHYWTHIPLMWALFFAGLYGLLKLIGRGRHHALALAIFAANIFTHMILDTVAGGIMWQYPWSDTMFSFVTIPDMGYRPAALNFFMNWTFLLELAIVLTSIAVFLRTDAKTLWKLLCNS